MEDMSFQRALVALSACTNLLCDPEDWLTSSSVMQHPANPDEQSLEPEYKNNVKSTFKENVATALKRQAMGDPNAPLPAVHEVTKGAIPSQKLYILPGSHRLIEFELNLNVAALNEASSNGVTLGAFRKLLDRLCEVHDFDLVFVDCGPSSGKLNQIIFFSSDYIIPPVFADYFSTTSVFGLLTSVLDKWRTWHKKLVEYQQGDQMEYESPFR